MTQAAAATASPSDAPAVAAAALDVERVRRDFPSLEQTVNGHPLAYFDNAASAQKPQAMIDAVARAYTFDYSNVHRGVHTLSQHATDAYEEARETARRFMGAAHEDEVIFVRGTTEAINLVAHSFVLPRLQPGDEVLISTMEHHSNIVPWQLVCQKASAVLKVVPINDRGELELDDYERLLGPRTRIVAMGHISNALGTVNPVDKIVGLARERGVPVLFDGAQAAPHTALDVAAMGCDFYTISGHKLFGPTGIGTLYARRDRHADMEPYQGGGEMIRSVTFERTEFNVAPHKFEAGTPHIVGAIGLSASMKYLEGIGLDAIAAYEHDLLEYATARLGEIPEVTILGTAADKAALVSFLLDGVHAHDIGTILDQDGIAVRAGHHCAQPVMDRFGVSGTTRASFSFYNTRPEIDRLVDSIRHVLEIFS